MSRLRPSPNGGGLSHAPGRKGAQHAGAVRSMRSGLWYAFGLVTACTLFALWRSPLTTWFLVWLFDGRGTREARRR